MKIKKSMVTKIKISEVDGLDEISVILEDLGPRQGNIHITCYGEAWTSYWGGMGDRTIAQFFCACDEHYLAGNLSGVRSTVEDFDALTNIVRRKIIEDRRALDVDADKAREQFDEAESLDPRNIGHQELLQDVLGDDWWCSLPSKPNPDYEYLCRIINTVKAAFKEIAK